MLATKEAAGLSEEQRRDYERAAVALEKFKPHLGGLVVIKAYEASAIKSDDNWRSNSRQWIRHTKRAARLLRDCLQRGEPLPC
jgi:hypothetical protein